LILSDAPATVQAQNGSIQTDGTFTHIRFESGQARSVALIGGSRLGVDGQTFELRQAQAKGTIEAVDYERAVLTVNGTFPPEQAGEFMHVSNPAYGQESAYRIGSINRVGERTEIQLAPTRLILGRGYLSADPTDAHTLPNVVPLEYAKSVARKASGFFAGKRIGPTGTRIRDVAHDGLAITVDSTQGFKAGDDLTIYDVSPGDAIRVPCWLRATRQSDGRWKRESNHPVD